MTYFWPAGGGGTWIFALATKSSKLLGARWFRNLNWIKARFNCCRTGVLPLSVITAAFAGCDAMAGFASTGLGAVGDAVFSGFAGCSGAAVFVSVADEGGGVALALSFFPQPEAKMRTPKTSVRENPGLINQCRTEAGNVFILKWVNWYMRKNDLCLPRSKVPKMGDKRFLPAFRERFTSNPSPPCSSNPAPC